MSSHTENATTADRLGKRLARDLSRDGDRLVVLTPNEAVIVMEVLVRYADSEWAKR